MARARSVQQAYDVLRIALAYAVRQDGILRASPIAAVARPRLDREIDFFTREETRKFLAAAKTDRYRALRYLVVATGLRWGEVAALRWADVDLEEAALTVRRALKETREFGSTKSRGGRRRIDLPASVVVELRRHRKKKWKPDDLVFETENGEPLHPSNLARRHLFPTLERAELRRIRFHDLRHTAAAIRLLAGQHPLVVKELLGHSSIRTTLDVYRHLQSTVSKDAAAEYDRVMKSK
jgi:integrase